MSHIVITVENLAKRYRIRHCQEGGRRYKALRDVLADAGKSVVRSPWAFACRLWSIVRGPVVSGPALCGPSSEDFWALKDVSFEVNQGDVVGIIGRNGAGKSTLLKILSRITEPTEGRVRLNGRVASLLEVGTGFHPELTGRENIFLNGAILGMHRVEIRQKFDEIVAFAEVEKFLDTPVKRYSSGMYVRLAFSVAAHLDPEIMIVDEVLAVGDAQFQQKCLRKMQEVARGGGRTVLLVSHQMANVRNLCQMVLYFRSGHLQAQGPTSRVLTDYMAEVSSSAGRGLENYSNRTGSGAIRCTKLLLRDDNFQEVRAVDPLMAFYFEVRCSVKEAANKVSISVDIDSLDGTRLATLYSGFRDQTFAVKPGIGVLRCSVPALGLRPDTYSLNVWIGVERECVDFVRGVKLLIVAETDVYGTGRIPDQTQGVLVPAYSWDLAPTGVALQDLTGPATFSCQSM